MVSVSGAADVTVHLTGHSGKHSFDIAVTIVPFLPQHHHIEIFPDRKEELSYTLIDGRQAYGTRVYLPTSQVGSIEGRIDGKPFEMPRRLYRDLFDVGSYEKPPQQPGGPKAWYSGNNVVLFIGGGDGIDTVWAYFRIRPNGRV